jgi:hypothetical protein
METSGFFEMSLYFSPYDITICKNVPMTLIAVTTVTAKSVVTVEIALVAELVMTKFRASLIRRLPLLIKKS